MTATICPVCGSKIYRESKSTISEIVYCHQCDSTHMLDGLESFEVKTYADPGYPRYNSHQRHPNKTNPPKCPLCGEKVNTHRKHHLGETIMCPACEGELEVVKINPLKLGLPHNGHYGYKNRQPGW